MSYSGFKEAKLPELFAGMFSKPPVAIAKLTPEIIQAVKSYSTDADKEAIKAWFKTYKGKLHLVLDDKGNTILHHAAMAGRPALVEYFIGKGIGVNTESKNGDSPLICALKEAIENKKNPDLRKRIFEAIQVLLDNKADNIPNRNNTFPKSAMGVAVLCDLESVTILEKAGFSVNEGDLMSPLEFAQSAKNVQNDIVEFLISKGAKKSPKPF